MTVCSAAGMVLLVVVVLSTSAAHAQRFDRDYPRDDDTYDYRDNRGRDRGERPWARGDRISRDYLDERYSHHGWRNNGLRQPRRGERWLVIGRHVREKLGPPVSHIRYLLAREVERSDGEVTS